MVYDISTCRARKYTINGSLIAVSGILILVVLFNNTGSNFSRHLHLCYYLFAVVGICFLCLRQKILFICTALDVCILLLLSFLFLNQTLQTGYVGIDMLVQVATLVYYISIRTLDWDVKRISGYYACVSIMLAGVAFYGWAEWIGWLESANSLYTLSGFFSNPGAFGGFLACGIMLLPGLLFQKQLYWFYRVGLIMVGIFVIGMIFLSESRAALIGVVLAVVFYGYNWIQTFKKYRLSFLLISGVVSVIAIYGIMHLKNSQSVSGRWFIWKIGLRMFLDNPWFGVGHNQYKNLYMDYQEQYFAAGLGSTKEIWLADSPSFAYNECLQFLIENGSVGTIGILLLGIFMFGKRKNFQSMPRWVGFTSATFFLSFFVFSQFSYPLHFLCFQLLLLNQLAIISSYDRSTSVMYVSFTAISTTWMQIFLGGLLCTSIYFYKGILYWQEAYLFRYENPEKSKILFDKAEKLLPNDACVQYDYGKFLTDIDIQKSTDKLLACSQHSSSFQVYEKLGENYEQLRNFAAAEKMYLKSHYRIPILLTPQYRLMKLHQKANHTEKMRFWAESIVATPIKVVHNPKARQIQQEARQLLQ